jgi:hypothetical protein
VSDNTTTTFYAIAIDTAGNWSACSSGYTYVETLAIPTTPFSLVMNPVGPSTDTTPDIQGDADPSVNIEIFDNASCAGTPVGSGTTDPSGDFSINLIVDVDSTNTFYAMANSAGVYSTCSTSVTYINDSTPPLDPLFLATSPISPSSNENLNVTGTTDASVTVGIYTDIGCTSVAGSGSSNGSGFFSIPVTVANNSTTTFWAQANDAAGNFSGCSSFSVTYVEDSTPPTLPHTLTTVPLSGANHNAPEVHGITSAAVDVTIYTNNTCSSAVAGTGTSDGSGNFAIAVSVADNSTTTFYATATDAVGNTSACSASTVSYVENSSIPNTPVPLSSLPASPSSNNTPSILGVADPDVTVNLYTDSLCAGTLLATGSTDGAGDFIIPVSLSNNATTTIYAQAVDALSVASACSIGFVYIEDSTAPAAPTVSGTSPVSPSDNNAPAVVGTTEANASISVYSDSGCTTLKGTGTANSSGAFSVSVSSVAEKSTTSYWAKATDGAGNIGVCSGTSTTFINYTIGEGAGLFTGTRTTNGTNFNINSPYGIQWSTSRFHSTYYSHSTTVTSERVTVLVAGNYQVSVNLPLVGAVTRGIVALNVKVNGGNKISAKATSEIAGVGGNDNSSVAMSVLLENLSANDFIEVTAERVGANGTITTSLGRMYLQFVPANKDIFSATATRVVSGTNLNNAVASPFQWTEVIKDPIYTHSNTVSSQSITLNSAGHYIVFLNVPVSTNSNRDTNMIVQLLKNGSLVPGAEAKQGYLAGTGGFTLASYGWSGVVYNASANDVLTVTTQQEAGTATTNIEAGKRASIYIEKLPDTADTYFGRGTVLTSSANFNSAAQSVQFTSDDLIDTSTFTHSTSTNAHQITVLKTGDYEFTYSDSVSGAVTNANFTSRLKVNGTAVSGAAANGHFISNVDSSSESSGTFRVILKDLAVNDVITVEATQEAAAGTVAASTSATVFIRKMTDATAP